MRLWDEYAAPNFRHPNGAAVSIFFIVSVAVIARLVRRTPVWTFDTIVPVLFFLYEGLKAQRHVLLLIIIAAVPIARDLTGLFAGRVLPGLRERLREFAERQKLAQGDAWLALVAAVVMTLLFLPSTAAKEIKVGSSATPKLVEFLRAHPDRCTRPLVTTWNAGPLLWAMRPDFRVSFDDRGDFYGDETVFCLRASLHRRGWLGATRWTEAITIPRSSIPT